MTDHTARAQTLVEKIWHLVHCEPSQCICNLSCQGDFDCIDAQLGLSTALAEVERNEREACARVADEYAAVAGDLMTRKKATAECIAAAIRDRMKEQEAGEP